MSSTPPSDRRSAPDLAPALTPHGRLRLAEEEDAPALPEALADRLQAAFSRRTGLGLLQLGAGEVGTALPAVFSYWREVATLFVAALCTRPEGKDGDPPPPPHEELLALASAPPPMTGAEYLTAEVLESLWSEMAAAFLEERKRSGLSTQDLLKRWSPAWNLVGRVHFNLAENRKDEEAPFAFLATYTSRLSAHGKAQHLPLGQALREYAGEARRDRLLSLLVPVQRAAEACPWLKAMVDAGEVFHPLRFTPREALQLLGDAPRLEAAGVVLRLPASWPGRRPPRPRVTATVGGRSPSGLGVDSLVDFRLDVALDGEPLTAAEVEGLLASTDGLALVRGRWVEVDAERLRRTLDDLRQVEREAKAKGVGFAEAMRMLAGARVAGEDEGEGASAAFADWAQVVAGPWLARTLAGLRRPEGLAPVEPGDGLRAVLRPYQQAGLRWLHLLYELGLGACLADDMGLGKTVQVLALVVALKKANDAPRPPSLLVAPASLLANWAAEAGRFAPGLRVLVAHPSALPPAELRDLAPERLGDVDLVVTSYGSLLRLPWLERTRFDLVVLDEAQAIKNPGARQTRAAKKLSGRARIALTGTPVENRLSDLWSIFDFVNPGLLGSAREFAAFTKRLAERPHHPFEPLRELVRPYVLRRLKTDRSVVPDLPEKTEVKAFCALSRKQAALYAEAVAELGERIAGTDGIARKGLVLAFLTRFKQICNHPSHWLGDASWAEADSGKLQRLREIAEVLAARQEKVLVFTQFREAALPLAAHLGAVFGREGLVLHGETPVKKRAELVRRFQEDEAVPFFVLSLKAGGTGLNLTAASHVVHFDRWWNPAVENQATDRAFRIGQARNVLVHKFVCRGTVEERIDELVESKQQLSRDLLEGGAERLLTEMADDEILSLVALDLRAAAAGE